MLSASDLLPLKEALASGSEILTNQSDESFMSLMKRWTDVGKQMPSAIVLPKSEEDIERTVQWALETSTPFVTKCGGHSEWSTIGQGGIIIDLSRYSGAEVDERDFTATLKGSVLTKEVATRLAEAGRFTALGNGNTVGAIPYFINGGLPTTPAITGFGSDNIVSARMITAFGKILDVNNQTHPDLLWAIRGAGQYFGLVTQLTIKTFPLPRLGNDNGSVWVGSFVFPGNRKEEVCSVMEKVMEDKSYTTSGLLMVAAPPPARKPTIIVAARFFGNPDDSERAFKGLYDLEPMIAKGQAVPIQNLSDSLDPLCAKGDYKRYSMVGMPKFESRRYLEVVSLFSEMVEKFPQAINSSFSFQWNSHPVKAAELDSAMSHHGVQYWASNLIWNTDLQIDSKVNDYNTRAIGLMRGGQEKPDYIDYSNGTREAPLETCFGGLERVARLKKLKETWDPEGVFTTRLLDGPA